MLKKLFLGLSLSLVPAAAMASTCSSCANGCSCESTGSCSCDKETCDCPNC